MSSLKLWIVLVLVVVCGLASLSQADTTVRTEDLKLHGDDGGGGPGAPGDYFGRSVAIDGDTAVVGAELNDSVINSGGLAYVFVRSEQGWVEQQQLSPSDPRESLRFGSSVAVSGNIVIVGAWRDDQQGNNAGAAYVFVRTGNTWVEQQKLVAADVAADDYFGYVVALAGEVALIGAWRDDQQGNNAGAAYVFVRIGEAWNEQQKLTATDAAADDQFGYAVALAGDTAIVGARGDENAGSWSGSAYVFVNEGSHWVERQKLTASDAASGDVFGASVDVVGNTAVVGSHLSDGMLSDTGSVYVFVRQGGLWIEQQKLVAADGAALDRFGEAVALADDTVLVGSWKDDDAGDTSGSAYLFARNDGSWSEVAKLVAKDAEAGDGFGSSVALSGATAVVGAPYENEGGQTSGAAYTFVSATPEQKLMGAANAAGDFFGFSAAIAGDTLMVGAIRDGGGYDTGSVYVFVSEGGQWHMSQKLIPGDAGVGDWFGQWIALSGDLAVIGAPSDSEAGSYAGAVYAFSRTGGVWSEQQKLIVSDAHAQQFFGQTVAATSDTILASSSSRDEPGALYVFSLVGDTWVERQKISAPVPIADDYFGYRSVVEGDTMLIGAGADDEAGVGAGAVYVFTRMGGAWVEEQKLMASDAAAGDGFGWPAMAGDRALIGATGADSGAGAVYAFAREGGLWVEQQRITASDPAPETYFGLVSMAGNYAIVSAAEASCATKGSGAAYLFEFDGESWVERSKLCASDGSSDQWFGIISATLSRDTAVVGAPADNDDGPRSGALYVFNITIFADGFEGGDASTWDLTVW